MVDLKISWNHGKSQKTVSVNETESEFYKEVGKVILDLSDGLPDDIDVDSPLGYVSFHVIKRGTYIENGVTYDSPFVQSCRGYITGLRDSEYPEAFLNCIHPESNNYKYYHFLPNNMGGRTISVGAKYGRIGSEKGELFGEKTLKNPIEPIMYWPRYYEKIAKGYKDVSAIMLDNTPAPPEAKSPKKKSSKGDLPKRNTASEELYAFLFRLAKVTVDNTFIRPDSITYAQVKEAKRLLDMLRKTDDVDECNAILRDLLCISARKARYIDEFFAKTERDIPGIVDREESLYNAMAMVVNGATPSRKERDSFESLGVEVYYANEWQRAHVTKRVPDAYKRYISEIYRVIPKERQNAFDAYLKAEEIDHIKGVHEKRHGSRNENWGGETGILANGLRFRNNAIHCGNMLGKDPAFYFADNFLKSKGYTSWSEAKWTNENSNIAVMGIFAVATGNVLEQRTTVHAVSKAELKRGGYHSTKAFKGAQFGWGRGLLDSEIAIFNEDACVCRYIVVFKK